MNIDTIQKGVVRSKWRKCAWRIPLTLKTTRILLTSFFKLICNFELNLSKVSYLAKLTSDLQGNIHSRASVNKTARDSFFLNIFWNVLLIDLGPYDSFLSTVWCVSIILNITAIVQVYLIYNLFASKYCSYKLKSLFHLLFFIIF